MRLFTRSLGAGPDLVLVHGWAFHSGVWEILAHDLAASWRVTLVDLPGHGRSPDARGAAGLRELAHAVGVSVPRGAVWLGWSLGGMVALQRAVLCPHTVRALVLVATTPRFVAGPEWTDAVQPEVLAGFARDLERDWRATLLRFLALQAAGLSRESLQRLRAVLLDQPATLPALRAGLAILGAVDLRPLMGAVRCPLLAVLGGRDTLVPGSVASVWSRAVPAAQVVCLERAGHAPHLSHPAQLCEALGNFIRDRVPALTRPAADGCDPEREPDAARGQRAGPARAPGNRADRDYE